MWPLIILSIAIGLILYYVFNLDFELGTGFTEMKRKMKEGKFRVVEKKEEVDLIEEKKDEHID